MDLKEKLISEFKTFESYLNGSAAGKIHDTRMDAKKYFELLGFPNRKMEDWRFTNINPIISNLYYQVNDTVIPVKEIDIEKFFIPGLSANIIVFVNGKYSEKHSKIIKKENLFIGTFRDALKQKPELIEKYFAKFADYKNDGFTALNTAYTIDGVFVHIGKNLVVEEPIIILNVVDSSPFEVIYNPRNLIIAEERSISSVIELYESEGNNFSFSNAVTEIIAGNNSEINYYKIQNDGEKKYHVGTTQISQEHNSSIKSFTLTWGGSIIRNNLNTLFKGEGGECDMKGLFIAKDNQQIDNHTFADHAIPNCHSNELYKGIMDDSSNGIFNGKIMVRKDAQKTNAYQMNKNIILSKKALVNSKPQLEIFADDVKCSHGATTGQLDEEQLFYLKTRGIGEDKGKKLLLYAFANEVIDDVKIESLRIYLQNILKKKLGEK
jgi:Fe-S cluster assembly protein SufD